MKLVRGEWPGSPYTGLVRDDEIRNCGHCKYFADGNCNEEHLVAAAVKGLENTDLLNEDGKSIKVKPEWCSNFFMAPSSDERSMKLHLESIKKEL